MAERAAAVAAESRRAIDPVLAAAARHVSELRAEHAHSTSAGASLHLAGQELAARQELVSASRLAAQRRDSDMRTEAARLRGALPPLQQRLQLARCAHSRLQEELVGEQARVARTEAALRGSAASAFDARREAARSQEAARRASGDVALAASEAEAAGRALGAARARGRELASAELESQAEMALATGAARAGAARRTGAAAAYAVLLHELRARERAAEAVQAALAQCSAVAAEREAELAALRRGMSGPLLGGALAAAQGEAAELRATAARREGTSAAARAALAQAEEMSAARAAEVCAWGEEAAATRTRAAALVASRDALLGDVARMGHARIAALDAGRGGELALVEKGRALVGVNEALRAVTRSFECLGAERSALASAATAAAQMASEMRARLEIQANEADILTSEAAAKDRALAKEHAAHGLSRSQRDLLRSEVGGRAGGCCRGACASGRAASAPS